ncbi:MAG: tRNA glutamyl-Q(34) synthetase GluQRS [Pseudomonadota bacterium]
MTANPQSVFRFAPSPNGRLHLGHAFSALTTHQLARNHGGTFLLRIEDIDLARSRPAYVDAIFEDLAWLGMTWPGPVLFQSTRFEAYRAAADRLRERGLLYPCAATRADRAAAASADAPRDPDGAPLYAPICKMSGRGFLRACTADDPDIAWRLDMRAAIAAAESDLAIPVWDGGGGISMRIADPAQWGDPVIMRKDVPASYHLAATIDDAHQGITHITRGQDLEPATDLHRLLQALLCLPTPVYHHHTLIRDLAGRKLSKTAQDTSLSELRAEGLSVEDVRDLIGL